MQDWENLLEQARKDWAELETEIQNRLQSRVSRKQLPPDEMEDLRKMEIPVPVDPNWIRPFFYRPILPAEDLFYQRDDYNLDPDLLVSSSKPWMRAIRKLFRPVRKFLMNLEAVLHRQAVFNEQQAALNDRLAHHTRLLHQLTHQLVVELTKLRLEHEALKMDLKIVMEQFEWYRQRHQVIERRLRSDQNAVTEG